jgi:septum formation protein
VADRIILASGSPRRRELLDTLGVAFDIVPADIDESVLEGEEPVEYVLRLGEQKAAAVSVLHPERLVIAADTTVDVDGEILGKPIDADDARRMLRLLSGRQHRVHTGLAVCRGEQRLTAVETTVVTFAALDDAIVDWYVGTGEPFDKAGGYGMQGKASVLVERIDGSVTNVIGLPLALLQRLTTALGHPLLP